MKRTTTFITLFIAGALALTGCTVKDVDQAPLAGPSTFFHSIRMSATSDTLTQNGSDFTDISITSLSPTGQSETVPLRAQIVVDGIAMDFGTLSTKTPTTPTTIRYTAPPSSSLAAQVPTTVTIMVTPAISGDFRGDESQTRQIDIRVLPQGVILPTNPSLVAAFTFSPATPQSFQVVTFDASTSTNGTTACGTACTYSWNFGDGSLGSGITTTHIYRTVTTIPVTLTVTDIRGAQATLSKSLTVTNPAQATGVFTLSPSTGLSTNTDILFNAANVQWAGRTIVSYNWAFGDGTSGSGVQTTHRYTGAGAYTVVLTLTDELGAQVQLASQTVTVTTLGGATARIIASTANAAVNQRVVFDATGSTPSGGARLVSYRFIYGDGGDELTDNPIQSHSFSAIGNYPVTVVITDSNGKSATASVTVKVE